MAAGEPHTYDDFVEQLCTSIPKVEAEAREHLDHDEELLLHLLMGDLLRTAVRLFHAGEVQVEQRLLHVIDLDGGPGLVTGPAVGPPGRVRGGG